MVNIVTIILLHLIIAYQLSFCLVYYPQFIHLCKLDEVIKFYVVDCSLYSHFKMVPKTDN